MTETQFNKQMAEAWITEVEGELELVDQLLKEVGEECALQPYEDDTIMKTLHDTGENLITAWGELGQVFVDVVSQTRSIINAFTDTVGKAIQGIGEFVSGIQI